MSVAVKLATRYVEMAGGALLPFTGKTFIATLLLIRFYGLSIERERSCTSY